MTLVFAANPECSTAEQREQLLAGLRVRLPELALQRVDVAALLPAEALVWDNDSAGGCALGLDTVDGAASIPLDPMSTESEIRAAVVRVAWWLELRVKQSETRLPGPTEPPKARIARPLPTPVVHFSVEFGVTYYPTLANVGASVRICAFVPVTTQLQLGVEGRLGTEVAVKNAPFEVDSYDRSLGLMARYEAPLSASASLGVTFGLRYALVQFDADLIADVHPASAASNLSLASGVGASLQIIDGLRLRGDLLAGFSVGSRRLVGVGGVATGDLGVLAIDLLLGFELSL